MMRKAVFVGLIALLVAAGVGLCSGCQTVKGVGQDLQDASQATEDALTSKKK